MRRKLRCSAQHPSYRYVWCEEPLGHEGWHHHSFYARRWPDENEPTPWWVRASHGTLSIRVSGGRAG